MKEESNVPGDVSCKYDKYLDSLYETLLESKSFTDDHHENHVSSHDHHAHDSITEVLEESVKGSVRSDASLDLHNDKPPDLIEESESENEEIKRRNSFTVDMQGLYERQLKDKVNKGMEKAKDWQLARFNKDT